MVKDRNEQQAASLLRIAAILKGTRISPEVLDQLSKAVKRRNLQRQNTTVGQILTDMKRQMDEIVRLLQPFEHEFADDLVLELLALL